MYPADIVSFRQANLEHGIKDFPMLNYYKEGYDYLVHRRSKTRNRNNQDMYIRIDDGPVLLLIGMLKHSFVYTHYPIKPEILAPMNDGLSIFNYSLENDYRLHKNVWDTYTKRIFKLLGCSFKTARKTFNTHALELHVSDTIRRILLGHIDTSELRSYDNLRTEIINNEVEEAHQKVLKEFNVKDLVDKLQIKLHKLNIWHNIDEEDFMPDVGDTNEDVYRYYTDRENFLPILKQRREMEKSLPLDKEMQILRDLIRPEMDD